MTEEHRDGGGSAFGPEAVKRTIAEAGALTNSEILAQFTRRHPWVSLAIVISLVLAIFGYLDSVSTPSRTTPSRQDDLVTALATFRSQYRAAKGNDLSQNSIKDSRNNFLCNFIGGNPQVQNWTGSIKSIDQTWFGLMGEYGLNVYIGNDIALETYGSALGESDQRNAVKPTNIQEGSNLAGALAGLKNGDRITFSGEFITDNGCARERSMTTRGSFDTPRLLFRFTTINGVSGNEPPSVSTITDGEKVRSLWWSANQSCTNPFPGYSQARIDKACRDRAAADAQLRALGFCFGKVKPGDADYWHKC